MTDPREERAYYEAGHAVISMKLGYRCLYVTIVPDGSRLKSLGGHSMMTPAPSQLGKPNPLHSMTLTTDSRRAGGFFELTMLSIQGSPITPKG